MPLRRGRCLHRPAVRALKIAAIYGSLPVFGRNVGRAISPALQHKAHGPQNREQRAAAHPKSLPCKGRCRRRRRRGAAPGSANILPGRRILPATIHPAKHGERPFPATALSRPPHTPAQGPMLASARRRVLKTAAVYGSLPLFGRNVGRAISPAAGALRNRRALRGKALPDPAGYFHRQPAMHPSVCAFRRIQLPLQGRLSVCRCLKSLPCKGRCRRRRRRGAAPCPANTLPGCCALPAAAHSCVGADACIGPPSGVEDGGRLWFAAPFRPQCRAGDLARRGALRHHRALRGKALPNLAGYFRRKPAMHPSVCAFRRIRLPLAGEPSGLQTGGPCKLPAAPRGLKHH